MTRSGRRASPLSGKTANIPQGPGLIRGEIISPPASLSGHLKDKASTPDRAQIGRSRSPVHSQKQTSLQNASAIEYKMKMEADQNHSIKGDRALSSGDEDRLGFREVAKRITAVRLGTE